MNTVEQSLTKRAPGRQLIPVNGQFVQGQIFGIQNEG